MVNVTETISLIELIYTVITAAGALVYLYLMVDSVATWYAVLIDGINGRVRQAALNELIIDVTALYTLIGFTVIGIAAMFAAPPPPDAAPRQLFAAWVFASVTVVKLAHAIYRFRRNRAGYRRIRQRAQLVADATGEEEDEA